MALPPQMVAPAMGPGGPGMTAEEQMTEVEVPVSQNDMLPPGVELIGSDEMVEVEAEEYDHNANLAEVLDDSVLGSLSSDLGSKIDEDKSSREEWKKLYRRA